MFYLKFVEALLKNHCDFKLILFYFNNCGNKKKTKLFNVRRNKSNQAVSNDLFMDRAWNNWVQMFLFDKLLCNFLET